MKCKPISLSARSRTSSHGVGNRGLKSVRTESRAPWRSRTPSRRLEGSRRDPPGQSAWSRERESRPLLRFCGPHSELSVPDMERSTGIAPVSPSWQPGILLLNHDRNRADAGGRTPSFGLEGQRHSSVLTRKTTEPTAGVGPAHESYKSSFPAEGAGVEPRDGIGPSHSLYRRVCLDH